VASDTNSAPLTLHPCVGSAGYVPSPAVVSCRWQQIPYRDLPSLMPVNNTPGPASNPASLDMACGMCDLIVEARLDRNDRTDTREVAQRPRTIQELLGDALIYQMLLMCRAPTMTICHHFITSCEVSPSGTPSSKVWTQQLPSSTYQALRSHLPRLWPLKTSGTSC
jgi:hypothetical protein